VPHHKFVESVTIVSRCSKGFALTRSSTTADSSGPSPHAARFPAVGVSSRPGSPGDRSSANSVRFGNRIKFLDSPRFTFVRIYRLLRQIVVMHRRHSAPERTHRIASDERSGQGHGCHVCVVEYPVDRILFRLTSISSASRLAKSNPSWPQSNSRLPRTFSAHRSTSLCGDAALIIARMPALIASDRLGHASATAVSGIISATLGGPGR
jgi:hypothetical protein